jgi:hypothetical protein
MKSINHAINGLASSLLLNVGLTRAAEKLDTVSKVNTSTMINQDAGGCEFCDWACQFTPDAGQ